MAGGVAADLCAGLCDDDDDDDPPLPVPTIPPLLIIAFEPMLRGSV